MQENSLSPFHSELLGFLKSQVEKQIQDRGLDPKYDQELKSLLEGLSPVSSDVSMSLEQIIENYQHFFKDSGPVYLEKVVMDAFAFKDFVDLGLGRYYPRMYRGLPRLYHRNFPTQSHIKKAFTHVPSLKKTAVARALYSLYSKIPVQGVVTLFTWVINDGFGDYVAAVELVMLLRAHFPDLTVHFIGMVSKERAKDLILPEDAIIIEYESECLPDLFSQQVLKKLRESDCILQMPTFYPHFHALVENLEKIESPKEMPTIESVGEYGFLESNWFHPKSGNHSMGLHFLEKGILIRKPVEASWDLVENEYILRLRNPKNHFYLAYLSTQTGGAIYLHSLLKALEHDESDIDLCVPDLTWFFKYVEKQAGTVLEWDLGVRAIEIHFQDRFHQMEVAERGKLLRLICPGKISQSDFRQLLALSGNWVGVRGNQSLSEAISQGKAFFYDSKEHGRYFIKDLVAIAENRIGKFLGTLECIRGMSSGFLYNLPVQEDEWVDETFFQTVEEWTVIALNLGLCLQDPQTYEGFRALSQIIVQEKSANSFFCHLVQRALTHKMHPEISKQESENLTLFANGNLSFKDLIAAQKKILCQKKQSLE